VDSPEYRYHFFRISEGQLSAPAFIHVNDLAGVTYMLDNPEDIQALMEAYRVDFDQHYTPEELYTGVDVGYLSLQYNVYSTDGSAVPYDSNSLNLYASYDNTLTLLRSVLPEAKFSWEELGIQAVNLSFYNVLNGQSLDTVCSWYGLNGYDVMEETIAVVTDTWEEQVLRDAELGNAMPEYQLLITDPKDLEELSEFLYVGSVQYSDDKPLAYLTVGYGYQDEETARKVREEEMAAETDEKVVEYYAEPTREQEGMKLFVKAGELPKEWIERVMRGGE
jgi:hypothetical protein